MREFLAQFERLEPLDASVVLVQPSALEIKSDMPSFPI
jgi:hypothetical protein